MTSLMDLVSSSEGAGSDREVEKALLLRVVYSAILWQESSDKQRCNANEKWKVVGGRLQLVEAGKWERLIIDLAANVTGCAARSVMSPAVTNAATGLDVGRDPNGCKRQLPRPCKASLCIIDV